MMGWECGREGGYGAGKGVRWEEWCWGGRG